MKFTKASSALGLFVIGLSSQALAVEALQVKDTTLKFYGQVNQALMSVNTGNTTEDFIVDNTNSPSRLGLKVSHKIDDNFTAGAHIELGFQSNPSYKVTPTQKSISGQFGERHFNAFLSGHFGKISIGQGDGAANGNTEIDLSGTQLVSWTNPALLGGGQEFFETTGGSNVGLLKTMSNLDFESRYDRLRYDLPKFGPLNTAISYGVKGNNSITELGARANFEVGGKLKAAAGYSTEDKSGISGDERTIGGSVSWLHASGLNLTGAYSTLSDDSPTNPDAKFSTVKVGYKTGKHAGSLRYSTTEDLALLGDESTSIGLGYVYTPIKWMNLYAGININSLDRTGSNFDDMTITTLGTRIKF